MIFNNLGNISEIINKAKSIQGSLKKVQQELKDTEIIEESGGVRIVISGDMELKELKIKPEVLENDKERIEYLIGDTVGKAYIRARNEAISKFKKMGAGLLPTAGLL